LDYFVVKEVGVNAIYTYGWKVLADLSGEIGNQKMKDYCMKQYDHFVKGLMTLYDEQEGRYISRFLNGSKFDKARKNTVQVLFPIMVPDIPQAHKDGIISMLSSVTYLLCRINIIAQIIRFQPSPALIHPITLFLALI
jgi:hypothetical protein